jgi:hypothetical protein
MLRSMVEQILSLFTVWGASLLDVGRRGEADLWIFMVSAASWLDVARRGKTYFVTIYGIYGLSA